METILIEKSETLINDETQKRPMLTKDVRHDVRPGISYLSEGQMKRYDGFCLGIVDGKVKFHSKSAAVVLKKLSGVKSTNKVFTCVPNSKISLVK